MKEDTPEVPKGIITFSENIINSRMRRIENKLVNVRFAFTWRAMNFWSNRRVEIRFNCIFREYQASCSVRKEEKNVGFSSEIIWRDKHRFWQVEYVLRSAESIWIDDEHFNWCIFDGFGVIFQWRSYLLLPFTLSDNFTSTTHIFMEWLRSTTWKNITNAIPMKSNASKKQAFTDWEKKCTVFN